MNLTVEKVTKRFSRKGTPAVFETSFDAGPGGNTTLLGPSGSGKTTLLRIIVGLEDADEGRVLVGGDCVEPQASFARRGLIAGGSGNPPRVPGNVDITRVPVRKRGFGFVFQTFALFDQMTVAENVSFGLEAQGIKGPRARERVEELLALVQLEGLGGRYPAQLSGGQRQRVGFARAPAPHPKLLLLDEPFGALDARVRVELRAWLRTLHAETHLTTIMVTHDQEEALELSDRIVVMDRGRVHQVGDPREVYESPATPFVASFVGTANVLRGPASDGRGSLTIVRPHDVRVTRAEATTDRAVARVRRFAHLGAYVKLELTLPDGGPMTVQLPRREFDALGVGAGDPVIVDLENARVFVGDYAI